MAGPWYGSLEGVGNAPSRSYYGLSRKPVINQKSTTVGVRGAGKGSPGFSLTLDDKRFFNLLERASLVVKDLSPAFAEVMRWNQKYNIGQFSLRTTGLYHPLSKKYFERKKKKLRLSNVPILVRYGTLANSLILANSLGAVRSVGPTSFVLGTKVPYAPYLQKGAPKRNLPARPFLFWDKYRTDATVEILSWYMTEGIIKALQIKGGKRPPRPRTGVK